MDVDGGPRGEELLKPPRIRYVDLNFVAVQLCEAEKSVESFLEDGSEERLGEVHRSWLSISLKDDASP